ncbi:MAG: hypothetical protein IJV77_05895 [Clostridia bacterium]|nr:hypothetical protein [Clostridia bacterium]
MSKKDKSKNSYTNDFRKEKSFSEKYKLTILKQKMYTTFFLTFPVVIIWLILAIISQKWPVFAFQSVCYLFVLLILKDHYSPPKPSIGAHPGLFGAVFIAFAAIYLTQFYFT